MIAIAKRNLKIFFRDRASVFFSLLGVLIVIGLYVLFLGDMMMQGFDNKEHARFMMDSWIMAGLLAVTSITTCMGAFGIMVDDRSKKTLKDFSSSPLPRKSLAAGYVLSSVLIGIIMSLLALVFAEVYIISSGGSLLSFFTLLKVLGTIILSVFSSSAIVFFIVSFFKSQNAFATASTVIGTLVGFLTGIYIPVGTLPTSIQYVVKIFPVSHSAALLRQLMAEAPIGKVFQGAPAASITEFKQEFGVTFSYGGYTATPFIHILVLVATILLFYGLSLLNLSRKRKN